MGGNYEILISKINEFRRKFYLNKLLRGTIYTLTLLLSLYLVLFLLIYFIRPVPYIKTILFFAYLVLLFVSAALGIVKPALAYFSLSKVLSLEESATLIGNHFEPIRDKLLNTLQLKALAELSPSQNQLILAGIDQKINDLKPIPFSNAISLNDNKKYVKYFLAPLALILLVAVLAPVVWREGTRSFIQYNKEILPAAPFNFVLRNAVMTVTQGDDLLIELELKGDQIPQEVYLNDGVNLFKLEKKDHTGFSYTFKNLQRSQNFRFSAGGFDSRAYQLTVKPRPSVLSIEASLDYPAYLGKKNEVIANAGDLILPEGTTVTWKIFTENAGTILFSIDGHTKELPMTNNEARFLARLRKSQHYQIVPKNNFSAHPDSVNHQIEVIPDLAPSINVEEKVDSLSSKAHYFRGNISDDHGFSSLKFIYIIRENGAEKNKVSASIPIQPAQQENVFLYYWNLKNLSLKPGQTVDYYLEVADNDAVNGAKKTRSAIKTYTPLSDQALSKQQNTESGSLKQKMNTAIKLAAEVERDSKRLGENLLDKKDLSFENKKEISQLLDKQKKLEETVKEIQQAKAKNSNDQLEEKSDRAAIADKQKQIDELFKNVLDPKTKALLEKLQSLMDQNNKDQVQNELSKMNMDNKSLKNELDRVLELYKQLEFEQNLANKVERLKKLSDAQKELSRRSQEKNADAGALKKQQEKATQEFKELQQELKQLDQKNQALERPNSFNPMDKESVTVTQQQQQSMENLEKKQQQKAAENQKKAGEEMQKMAKEMEDSNQASAEMENNLNTEELRRLLQNLLQTSFDQEKVMLSLKKISPSDPAYTKNVQQQRDIKDNMKTIADSLSSLSRRIPQIESTVSEEMQKINFNVDKSLESLAERRTTEAARNQQYTMTSVNNLSLMLNEALDQLEKAKKNAKSGGKGKGKQSMQQLQKMQEQLNKNMQQAKQQLEKEGNKGTVPKGKMTEGFAKMAQQQQMIREALQKINAEENKDGKGSLGNLNQLVKEMKMTESDLINKRLEEETIRRQQGITTKLLDAEKASRDQDEEGKRESQAGKDFPPSYPKMLEEFKKSNLSEKEFLQKLPPTLNYYYKNKISAYFKSLNLLK
ncbi:hypothetical protein OQY15_05285 [Pedobacter sp. MC2016-15]|uniref:DUF4175 family protein n=1 Tax=Pedobacter sp. MC2016-15 TaxID=2994473 RepID=UPI00224524EA|nr:DUF4175 family protein [Pedobacter sp. MC2016-15]MCX2478493.1 hypothetical protein [Pedobacter sp. MC2016-15]